MNLDNGSVRTESPEVNDALDQSYMYSEHSYSAPFELIIVIICIGFIGMLANGAVLWALVSKRPKGNTKIFILNQTVADFFSCTFLLISYAPRVSKIYLSGVWGSLLCTLLFIDGLIWVGLIASITSLVILTLERYFKIVHPVLHRKHFRPWIFKAAVLVTWGNGILRNLQLGLSARVTNGLCADGQLLKTFGAQLGYAMFLFVWDFLIPLTVFFYCYGRIVVVVGSTRSNMADISNTLSHTTARIQTNVIRTLILVSATFIVCWTPCEINRMLLYTRVIPFNSSYYVIVAVAFLNAAVNPLIYAAKYQPVRKRLLNLIGCRDRGQTVAPMATVDDTLLTRSVAHM